MQLTSIGIKYTMYQSKIENITVVLSLLVVIFAAFVIVKASAFSVHANTIHTSVVVVGNSPSGVLGIQDTNICRADSNGDGVIDTYDLSIYQ
jgi:hypothetical protein